MAGRRPWKSSARSERSAGRCHSSFPQSRLGHRLGSSASETTLTSIGGVLLERVDRQLDPLVRRRLDADERLSVADILSKAFAEIPENDRAEERGFELGFHRRWDGSDFLECLENDIAGWHALGLQRLRASSAIPSDSNTPTTILAAICPSWSSSPPLCPSGPTATRPGAAFVDGGGTRTVGRRAVVCPPHRGNDPLA